MIPNALLLRRGGGQHWENVFLPHVKETDTVLQKDGMLANGEPQEIVDRLPVRPLGPVYTHPHDDDVSFPTDHQADCRPYADAHLIRYADDRAGERRERSRHSSLDAKFLVVLQHLRVSQGAILTVGIFYIFDALLFEKGRHLAFQNRQVARPPVV